MRMHGSMMVDKNGEDLIMDSDEKWCAEMV